MSFTEPINCHKCGHEIGKAPAVDNTFPPSDPFPLPSRCPKCGAKQRLPKARFVQKLVKVMLVVVPVFLVGLLVWMTRRGR